MATGTLEGTTIAARYKSLLKLTGTANDVLESAGSEKYVEDGDGNNSVLSLSTGRVGIGTTAPATVLDIRGTVNFGVNSTGYDIHIFGDSGGGYVLWDGSANSLIFTDSYKLILGTGSDMEIYHNGSHSYIMNKTGTLKIATETSGIAVTIGHSTSEVTIGDNLVVTGTTTTTGTITVGIDGAGHDVKFFGDTSGKYMEWDESANQLDVTGSLDVTGDTTLNGIVTVSTDGNGHDVKFFGATGTNGYMLWDASTDDLILGSSSKLGIGVTSPGHPLEVKGGGDGNYVAFFDNSGTGSTAHGISISAGDADHADSDTHYINFLEGDSDLVGHIDSDGGTLAINQSSDERLKKDIVDTVTKGLEIINGTRMVDFKWKKNDYQVECGMIAQELQKVLPRIVKEGDDSDKTLGIRVTDFIPILMKAIQELSAKVEALENA